MNILTLDLGTHTGYAVGEGGRLLVSGVHHLKSTRYDGGGMRYLRFRNWLTELKTLAKPDVIYFEEVRRHASTDAAHVHGGLLAVLTAWCEEQAPKIPYQGVPVGTIKKHATGKGNASKEQVEAGVRKRWPGVQPVDDNEADALAILGWALEQHPEQPAQRKRVRVAC